MAEQGLKAVVYPVLDEYGMSEFVKNLQEQLGSGFVNVGMNIPDNATQNQNAQQTSETKTDKPATVPTQNDEGKNITKDEVTEAVKDGTEKSKSLNKTESEKNGEKEEKNSLKETLGSIVGKITEVVSHGKITQEESAQKFGSILGTVGEVGSALGVGAVSVAQNVQKILGFLMESSPALREVFDLFGTLVRLIWMPIGTILAVELMPMITNIAQDIGEWMSEAWEIYDKEGWTGLITRAVEMTFTVLIDMLGFLLPPIFTALGEMIWNGLGDAWRGFTNWVGEKISGFIDWLWNGFMNISFVKFIVQSVEGLFNWFDEFVKDPLGAIKNLPTTIWNGMKDGLTTLLSPIDNLIPNFTTALNDAMSFLDPVVGWVQKIGEFLIDGLLTWFDDLLKDPLGAIKNLPTAIWNGMKEGLATLLSPLDNIIPNFKVALKDALSFLDPVVDWVQKIAEFLLGPIDSITNAVTDFVNDPAGTINNAVNNFVSNPMSIITDNPITQALGNIGNALGLPKLFAEGGIVTQPTLSITGEAGPEAIIPLNQFSQIANDYSKMDTLDNNYKIETQNINGGNTMNFYINGNNATEIGGEVQRILEKTVGKASSKMMWW